MKYLKVVIIIIIIIIIIIVIIIIIIITIIELLKRTFPMRARRFLETFLFCFLSFRFLRILVVVSHMACSVLATWPNSWIPQCLSQKMVLLYRMIEQAFSVEMAGYLPPSSFT